MKEDIAAIKTAIASVNAREYNTGTSRLKHVPEKDRSNRSEGVTWGFRQQWRKNQRSSR
jgi:hypothetical protein